MLSPYRCIQRIQCTLFTAGAATQQTPSAGGSGNGYGSHQYVPLGKIHMSPAHAYTLMCALVNAASAHGRVTLAERGQCVIPSHVFSYPIDAYRINICVNAHYAIGRHSLMPSTHGLAGSGIGAPPTRWACSRGPSPSPPAPKTPPWGMCR